MKALLEPLAVQVALLVAGLGALRTSRILGPPCLTNMIKAGGLAYLVGIALVMQTCVLLLVIGLPFGLPMVGLVCLAFAAPLLVELRRVSWHGTGRALTLRRPRNEETVVVIALGAFAVLAVVGLITLGNDPVSVYDAWNLWARKAALMFFGHHLPLGVLSSAAGGYIHPDYPLLIPLLEAANLRALHRFELSSAHTVIWALAIGFVWAGVYLGSRVARPSLCAVVFPGIIMLTLPDLLTAYADVPMAFYLGLAALALAIWLESQRRRDLIVAMMLFAGAAGIKNEGLMGTVVVIAAAIVVLASCRRLDRLKELVLAAVALGAFAILPWHLWLVAHNLKGDIPFPGGLEPSYLINRLSRVGPGITGLYDQLANVQTVAVAVPIAIAVIIMRLRRPQRTAIVWFYLLAGLLYFAVLVWAYWVNPIQIQFLVTTSANRVYVGLAFIALVGILDLADLKPIPSVVKQWPPGPGGDDPP